MANFVQTNEGIANDGEYEDEELQQWLSSNNIQCAARKLLEKKVTLHELAEIDPRNAKEYAKKSLGLDEIDANRFANSIQLLAPNRSKSQIIVLGQQANDALNKLYDKKEEMAADIKNIKTHSQYIKDVNKINAEQIDKFKQQVIDQLNHRLNHLLRKSNKDITKQIDMCSNHLELLRKHNKELHQIDVKINELLSDDTLSKTKREAQIIVLSEAAQILDKDLIEPNISPRIKISINKNVITQHVNRIGNINYSPHTTTIKLKAQKPSDCDDDEKMAVVDRDSTDPCVSEMVSESCDITQLNETEWKQTYLDTFGIIFKEMDETNELWKTLGQETECLDHGRTITKLSDCYSSHFGNVCIRSVSYKVCVWHIKVNKVSGGLINRRFGIGISSGDSCKDTVFYDDRQSSNYAYYCNGNKVSKGRYEKYGESWFDGDVIGIILDEIQKCIQFTVNGKSQGIAYKNIDTQNDITYTLAVHMYYKHNSVTILKYECL
eukprot:192364_1